MKLNLNPRKSLKVRLMGATIGMLVLTVGVVTWQLLSSKYNALLSVQHQVHEASEQVTSKLHNNFEALKTKQIDNAHQMLDGKANSIAHFVAQLAPTPLLTFDVESLDKYVAEACSDADVELCYIVDATGTPSSTFFNENYAPIKAQLAQTPDIDLPTLAQSLHQLGHSRQVTADILSDSDAPLGKVILVISTRSTDEQTAAIAASNTAMLEETREEMAQLEAGMQDASSQAIASGLIRAGIIDLIAIALCSVMVVFLCRSIIKPTKALLNKMAQVSTGDLTLEIQQTRQDEIGEMEQGFGELVKTLRGLIVEVSGGAHEVASAASEIANASDQMAVGTKEQAQEVESTSAAIREMNQATCQISSRAIDAANMARQSKQVAEEGGQIVSETVTSIQSISQIVLNGSQSVSELGNMANQIGSVVEVINDIADQTNLLALNASIEAARAGEHGRGFAVVADEVRKLADRTTSATHEITESITSMQHQTEEAVDQISSGADEVKQSAERATNAGASLSQIVESVSGVAGMVEEIASAAEEQSQTAEHVNTSVDSIAQVTTQNTAGSAQTASTASNLTQRAEQLNTMISKFTV